MAAKGGDRDIVELLVEKGADIKITDDSEVNMEFALARLHKINFFSLLSVCNHIIYTPEPSKFTLMYML